MSSETAPARLTRRAQFDYLRAHGTTLREGRLWIVHVVPDADAGCTAPAVGFAISKRFGSAVARNRARRRLRAIVREISAQGSFPDRWLLVSLIPRDLEPSYGELETSFRAALQRIIETEP